MLRPQMPDKMKHRFATLALALLGTAVFWLLGLPLPCLFGPMAACLIAALAGAPLKGMGTISTLARTILGAPVAARLLRVRRV